MTREAVLISVFRTGVCLIKHCERAALLNINRLGLVHALLKLLKWMTADRFKLKAL